MTTNTIDRADVMTAAWVEIKDYMARRAAKGFKLSLSDLRDKLSS